MRVLAASTGLLFRIQIARIWWTRRTLACAAIAGIPPLVAWLLAIGNPRTSPAAIAAHIGWLLLVQVVTPILALLSGSAVVTEEIEDRTITYLFSRPIPRAAVLLGRWLASLVVVSGFLGISAVLTCSAAGALRTDPELLPPLLQASLIGGAVYSGLFASVGVFAKHPMIVGLGYTFAVEGFLANLPGKNQSLTIQYYLRSLIASRGSHGWSEIAGFAATRFETAGASAATLAVLLAGVLLLASWRIGRREFVVSA
jgi:ABC-type transport system involved in multi-copper enzyme maturation permease subunit